MVVVLPLKPIVPAPLTLSVTVPVYCPEMFAGVGDGDAVAFAAGVVELPPHPLARTKQAAAKTPAGTDTNARRFMREP